MELPAILTSTLQGIGGIATIVFANWIGEHILNRRLLSGIWVFVKKWWYKKTKEVDIKFIFRIDFSQKLDAIQLKNVLEEFVGKFERNRQWNKNEMHFEVKNDYIHRITIRLIHGYREDVEIGETEGALVSIKTQFKLGNLRDCLSSISSLSDKLMTHLTMKYNLPFFVRNGEFDIWNPKTEFEVPHWLRQEGFKLSILAQTAEDLNLQLYLDHAKIETKGITFEPKVSKYLEEIFVNYYVAKDSFKSKSIVS